MQSWLHITTRETVLLIHLNLTLETQYSTIRSNFYREEKKCQETTFRIRSNVVYLRFLCSAAHIFKCRMFLLYCRVNFQLKDETRLSSSITGICFYPFSRLTDVDMWAFAALQQPVLLTRGHGDQILSE